MKRDEQLLWFAKEVLPHEAALRRWLGRRAGAFACDPDEIVQETYARLWAANAALILAPRAYMFVTARRVLGDLARRARIVSIETMADIEALNIVGEESSAERTLSAREELAKLMETVTKLPPQCRKVFELRKFEGFSQRETAQSLGISESTVEKHLSKALQVILDAMTGADETDGMDWNGARHVAKRRRRSAQG